MVYKKRDGREYEMYIGSRVLVKRGKAYMTSGGLKAGDIFVTKDGRYVSRKKHEWGVKKGKRQLSDAGYELFAPGTPGRVSKRRRTTRRRSSTRRR